MMPLATFNQDLLSFLNASPTPYHAVVQMREALLAAGFVELEERTPWTLSAGGRYFVVRNGSTLIAFRIGTRLPAESGLRMWGAHTDSPCLKVKPFPELCRSGTVQLGVEVYGGALLAPWFDRDLSMAGRVSVASADGRVRTELVNFVRAIATVPSLAIHLDRDVNTARSINAQRDLPPVVAVRGTAIEGGIRQVLADELTRHQQFQAGDTILDFEISLYDTQPAALIGLDQDMLASARLDNLLSCWIGLRSLIDSPSDVPMVFVANDHEEVGSQSAEGAAGTGLNSVLERWIGQFEQRAMAMARSIFVSCDNAHAVHPNYADKHDGNHGPLLNGGPVIKVNSNQRYATSSVTAGVFRQACQQAGIPVQTFVTRSDLGCGSTIGPVTAAKTGVNTIDVGVPQLGMHSIRELAGHLDAHRLYQALVAVSKLDVLPAV